ncbi:o-succinylbenzoate synthase [Carboxylicivirga sp. N1Y90]|uniref:o-succinylbenzoate synthase n=1 Tax=Carboxylicivirga fragile TaxID=3417571 RepID=UPI003D34B64C|nr:o-succinylbenzoate synthase [Marinilabiliaceae bacterium N1Y90]
MLKASFSKHILKFRKPGGTSRGVLYEKPSWYIKLEDKKGNIGIGECSLIPGLSPDNMDQIELQLQLVCDHINDFREDFHARLVDWPAIRFALEMAFKGLETGNPYLLYPSLFTSGSDSIAINGLIWMGSVDDMNQQIEQKLDQGFSCLKLKIGALDFESEIEVLKNIRKRFSKEALELRVDANGAFAIEDAGNKLKELAQFDIHSIEQPIQAGQWEAMRLLCRNTPLAIALDEELIAVNQFAKKKELLALIEPQYIILKPSLLGGWKASEEWIAIAQQYNIAWWVTSALEGNVGLNAIAQWTYTLKNRMPQGLGTGQVYTNNVQSPLYLKGDALFHHAEKSWVDPFKL